MIARKTACGECPFKKDSIAGWLAEYSTQDLHNLVMSEQPFPYHMTHQKDVPFDKADELPLCAGALAYMRKGCKSPRNKEHAEFVKQVSKETLDNTLSRTEFFEHHNQFKH